MDETDQIKERYKKRNNSNVQNLYSYLRPEVYLSQQEKERALIDLLNKLNWEQIDTKKVLEVGCGSGGNLHHLIRLGFNPENLTGNELLEDRLEQARRILPTSVKLILGDARNLETQQFDMVIQSTVFTSILDADFRAQLAQHIWSMVAPGGGVLWYDFTFDNPKNPDVKGIKLNEIQQLFPDGSIQGKRVTLAPPISRRVCKLNKNLYHFFNFFPFLRTHTLLWIAKS